jgi:hypothetical protein
MTKSSRRACRRENKDSNSSRLSRWSRRALEPFSLEHLKLDYEFMKMDGEGCEELLLSLPRVDKPCVVEVHTNKLLNKFIKKCWLKIHSITENVHLVKK